MKTKISWSELIEKERVLYKDTTPCIWCNLTTEELNRKFIYGYCSDAKIMKMYTEKRVYITVDYDTLLYISSISLTPNDEEVMAYGT